MVSPCSSRSRRYPADGLRAFVIRTLSTNQRSLLEALSPGRRAWIESGRRRGLRGRLLRRSREDAAGRATVPGGCHRRRGRDDRRPGGSAAPIRQVRPDAVLRAAFTPRRSLASLESPAGRGGIREAGWGLFRDVPRAGGQSSTRSSPDRSLRTRRVGGSSWTAANPSLEPGFDGRIGWWPSRWTTSWHASGRRPTAATHGQTGLATHTPTTRTRTRRSSTALRARSHSRWLTGRFPSGPATGWCCRPEPGTAHWSAQTGAPASRAAGVVWRRDEVHRLRPRPRALLQLSRLRPQPA